MNHLNTREPFSRRQGAAAGVRPRDLTSGSFRRLTHDSHVQAGVPDHLILRARAVLSAVGPGWVLSHHTAATLWGGTVPLSSYVHVAARAPRQLIRSDVKCHRYIYDIESSLRYGLPLTTPEMTFSQLARELDLVDLVALGDSLVRRGVTTQARLHSYVATWNGQKKRLLYEAAGLVRSGVDSAPETRVRLLLHFAGLPDAETDIRLHAPDGALVYRLDLGYRDLKLAIEYDGAWHNDPDQSRRDRARRQALADAGWDVLVITSRDLFEEPAACLTRVCEALRKAGVVVGRLSDRWRRHFRTPVKAA